MENESDMNSMYYAQELSQLWSQYKQQSGDHPALARQTLKAIVGHCDFAIASNGSLEYFRFHRSQAEKHLLA